MYDISKYLRLCTQGSILLSLYDRIAYLTWYDHAMFDDDLGFFPRLFLLTDEIKLPPLQERIIILDIFRLAIRILPDHMNIPMKQQIATQFSQR